MTRAKPTKRSALRNAEYYDFQDVLDKLYADSENGCQFQQLTELICNPQNIMLAYRNIKKNSGSKTAGTDKKTIVHTLTATDRHAVYSRQRVDDFRHNDVASTQSARQYKDATDLICQQAEACAHLIRRLTPLECERLQGFPDGWTDIPGASDSARYKALGNSVAIPCVEFIMSRIAAALL